MKVTRISPQKNKKDRFNIFIDEKYTFSLSSLELIKQCLAVGDEIQPDRFREIKKKALEDLFYEKSLNFLSYRIRSQKEISDYLIRYSIRKKLDKSETIEFVPKILERLKKAKLINDKEFSIWYTKQLSSSKTPKGTYAIKSELFKKGVSRKIIDTIDFKALDKVSIGNLADIKYKKYKKNNPNLAKQKTLQYLMGRGFSFDDAIDAIDSAADGG